KSWQHFLNQYPNPFHWIVFAFVQNLVHRNKFYSCIMLYEWFQSILFCSPAVRIAVDQQGFHSLFHVLLFNKKYIWLIQIQLLMIDEQLSLVNYLLSFSYFFFVL